MFTGVMYLGVRKQIGPLLYKGDFSAQREQNRGIISGIVLCIILVIYYYTRKEQNNMKTEMYFFVVLISFMTGRTLFPLAMSMFLPSGIYDNGVVTGRGFVLFKNVKRHDIHDTKKARDNDVLFLRLYSTKLDFVGSKALMIDRKDRAKVQKLLKRKNVAI